MSDWIKVKERIPQPNILVKVRLTNGVEAIDFVNEPLDGNMPFQHYRVDEWRELTRDELHNIVVCLGIGKSL